jgi:hypothetical protein
MTPAVQSMVAATYVRDIDTSRAFYELLGFHEQSAGKAAMPCEKKAEVKLADSAGDKVWGCLAHADEILMTVAGAFIATESDQGIAGFLSRRPG